ncbi:TraR/DksA family transcriptional regulator [Microbacterium sp. Marseille-Q6965]|uniref:TraR/DksA family transcriptional regulator n=1 Tax=Microbacterium sp. Marseille-Q6965 TaxID=2965072 RepID=UPI0021B71463|nr:TraR/DksA family transcriptional regulator [Microbacterium sp. Marseille-Q6965]
MTRDGDATAPDPQTNGRPRTDAPSGTTDGGSVAGPASTGAPGAATAARASARQAGGEATDDSNRGSADGASGGLPAGIAAWGAAAGDAARTDASDGRSPTDPSDPIDPGEFRQILEERRAHLLAGRRRREDARVTMADARSAATADDEHDPEGGTLAEEWSRLAGLDAQAATELSDVEDALARLDAGTYGSCARCGRPIPVERLRARPSASLCVRCAAIG